MDEDGAGQGRSKLWLALKELTEGRGVQRGDLLEALGRELSELRRCWSVNLNNGPKVARDTIRVNLLAHFEKINPPASGPRSTSLSRKEQIDRYWQCARVSFNMQIGNPGLLEMDIAERRQWLEDPARGKMRLSTSTRQRYLVHVIDSIEKQILAAGYVPVSHEEMLDEQVLDTARELAVTPTIELESLSQRRPDQPAQNSQVAHPLSGNLPPEARKRPVWKLIVLAGAVIVTAGASVGATIFVAHLISGHGQPRSAPDTTPKVASASSPPVLLENVSPLASDSGLSFVLPGKLDMTPAELTDFGNNLAGNPDTFASWFKEHKGVSLGNSSMHLTLVGNLRGETIRITDINLFKQCHEPTGGGTIFTEPGQGEPSDIPMGFDLDSPKPVAQDEGFSTQTGPGTLLPTKFFDSHTISLAYDEQETLKIDMHGSSECTFTFQLVVATPSGTLTEKIDDNGRPFEITAMAKSQNANVPFAGYQVAYVNMVAYGDAEWKKVDPSSFSYPSLPQQSR